MVRVISMAGLGAAGTMALGVLYSGGLSTYLGVFGPTAYLVPAASLIAAGATEALLKRGSGAGALIAPALVLAAVGPLLSAAGVHNTNLAFGGVDEVEKLVRFAAMGPWVGLHSTLLALWAAIALTGLTALRRVASVAHEPDAEPTPKISTTAVAAGGLSLMSALALFGWLGGWLPALAVGLGGLLCATTARRIFDRDDAALDARAFAGIATVVGTGLAAAAVGTSAHMAALEPIYRAEVAELASLVVATLPTLGSQGWHGPVWMVAAGLAAWVPWVGAARWAPVPTTLWIGGAAALLLQLGFATLDTELHGTEVTMAGAAPQVLAETGKRPASP